MFQSWCRFIKYEPTVVTCKYFYSYTPWLNAYVQKLHRLAFTILTPSPFLVCGVNISYMCKTGQILQIGYLTSKGNLQSINLGLIKLPQWIRSPIRNAQRTLKVSPERPGFLRHSLPCTDSRVTLEQRAIAGPAQTRSIDPGETQCLWLYLVYL